MHKTRIAGNELVEFDSQFDVERAVGAQVRALVSGSSMLVAAGCVPTEGERQDGTVIPYSCGARLSAAVPCAGA